MVSEVSEVTKAINLQDNLLNNGQFYYYYYYYLIFQVPSVVKIAGVVNLSCLECLKKILWNVT